LDAIAMIELDLHNVVPVLQAGGVITYPTEAVWGLGCDPGNAQAVLKLLSLKQRPVEKGMILVAADPAQLEGWVQLDALAAERRQAVLDSWPGANTWIVPAGPRAPRWITGAHTGIAVRVSAHPLVQALCTAWGGPLVSTSANLAGEPPARSREQLDPALLQHLDGLLDGATGGLAQPTRIRVAATGDVLRD
jgi:L-threonylcarbamoyladenylate synthase